MIKLKDIVNKEYIGLHQEDILKLGDVIPSCIFKYIPEDLIKEYFEYNKKNNLFVEDFKTIDEWKTSEKLVLDSNFPEEIVELLKEWVECYPQFEGILNEENFDEFIEMGGKLNHSEELMKIEKKFHELINYRAGHLIKMNNVKMPHISQKLVENTNFFSREDFPVPGMYGGFYYYLTIENHEFVLYADSWSRIVGGSGQTHKITVEKVELIEEGFV